MGTAIRSGRLILSSAILASGLMASSAEAALTISESGANKNVTCTSAIPNTPPYTCTPNKASATLSMAQLTNLLASGDVTVNTGGALAMDIEINQGLTWVSSSTLTLDAYHSIRVEHTITVEGPGGLTLITNDGGTGGIISYNEANNIIFNDTSSALTINDGGSNPVSYTLVNSNTSFQNAMTNLANAIASNPSGNYALGYDVSGTDLTGNCTLVPTTFTGRLEGLNHTIKGVKLTYTGSGGCSNFGVFASLQGASIAHVNVAASKLVCEPGNLPSNTSDCAYVGGLVAQMDSASQIIRSTLFGTKLEVKTAALTGAIGGLAGAGGIISGSTSGGKVSVIGFASGVQVGGLAGTAASIDRSNTASGDTVVASNVGAVGGLVGQGGAISDSYETASVTGAALVGGLVGEETGTIVDSYAKGAVNGNSNGALPFTGVGGLVGEITGCGSVNNSIDCIATSYSTGAVVNADGYAGGLIGFDDGTNGALVDAYWDTTTSGISNLSQGVGNVANDPGVAGLTSTQFLSGLPVGFSSTVWKERPTANGGFPYLLNNIP